MDTKRLSEFVLGLYGSMLNDVEFEYPALRKEFVRDYKRICSAIDQHGLQFALISMPDYRKHFDKCLDSERLTKSGLTHFGSFKTKSPVPRLFKGLVLRVFDESGSLRSCPDVRAIFWLRQLLGAVRKLKLDCSDSSTWEQVDEFFKTDATVRLPNLDWDSPARDCSGVRDLHLGDLVPLRSVVSEGLFPHDDCRASSADREVLDTIQGVADILVSAIGRFNPYDWRARHGPGAVADHNGSYKYDFQHWPVKLQDVFPYDQFGVSSVSAFDEDLPASCSRDPSYFDHEPAARLIAVPKSLKGPRLIAAEPTAHQWCQQVIRDFLMTRTDQTLIGSFVAFRRQDLSQEMVRRASIDGSLSTMDLSSASDRLSCAVVERVFRSTPSTLQAFMAVRTRWMTQTLDRFLPPALRLRKFSTMGSALTFPVQSIVFAAFAIGCAMHTRGLKPSIHNIRKLKGSVRVFGDDIIVPSDALDLLGNTLELAGLKVNVAKTFGTGRFRESCGADAFGGHLVTTINVNEFPRKSAPGAVMSSVDVHNNLLNGGLMATAEYVRKTVEQLGYKFLTVQPGSGAFGWNDYGDRRTPGLKTRWNPTLHRREARIHTAKVVVDRVLPEGYPGLLQFFTEATGKVTGAFSSIGYSPGRPKNKLVLRWAAQP